MKGSWKAVLGILLVFALGCLSGALATSIFMQRQVVLMQREPAVAVKLLENKLTRHLNLDPDQQQQIHQILAEYLNNRRQLQQRLQPQVQVLNMQMVHQVGSVLRPEQMERFHDNLADIRRGLGHLGRRPGDGSDFDNALSNPPPSGAPPVGAPPPHP